jgi:hypothetical protein
MLVPCIVMGVGCSRAHVTVQNRSGLTLSNLVVSGLSCERHTKILATNSEWVTVTPYWGDAATIGLSFDCAGKSYTQKKAAEFKHAPHDIDLSVQTNMTVFSYNAW